MDSGVKDAGEIFQAGYQAWLVTRAVAAGATAEEAAAEVGVSEGFVRDVLEFLESVDD